MSRVHVIGAGLAGLTAALDLVDADVAVTLYEAGPAAGGRCRSYVDKELGCRIDNGNHLWLSGNKAIAAFLRRIGSEDTVSGPKTALFPFFDLATGHRWTVRPNGGRLPWWVLVPSRSVPGASLREFRSLLSLLRAGPDATITDVLKPGPLYTRLLEPLVIAALNTPPEQGSASLMAAVIRETLARGGDACVPAFPRDGLSNTFIDPALAALRSRAEIHLGRRVSALTLDKDRVTAFNTADGPVTVSQGDSVVLAVPAPVAQDLMPGLTAPESFEAIVNLHYRADASFGAAGFVGLLNATAEWAFIKPGIVSVTISAANRLVDRPASDLAATVWPEIAKALDLSHSLPVWRVVKEKRATFAATPAVNRKRPNARTPIQNLVLAGDWTATGLPATIEGAIRSGHTAANMLLSAA